MNTASRLVLLLCAVTAPLVAGTLSTATASSGLCRQLEAQLAEAGRRGSAAAGRYAAAAERQRAHLARTRAYARQARCTPYSGGQCAELTATIRSMERNLAQLSSKAEPRRGGRAAILARLESNGCRTDRSARRPTPEIRERGTALAAPPARQRAGPNPSESIAENRQGARAESGDSDRTAYISIPARPTVAGGTFRTMCVRTCDGYFFPMSFNSDPADFDRDERGCQSMCPGAETRLYAHRLDQESSDMISVRDGTPYVETKTAFAYKQASFVPASACTCRAAPRNFSIIAGQGKDSQPDETLRPAPRPDPGLDPDSAYDAATGLDRSSIKSMLNDKPLASEAAGERNVRVVGPAFLPDRGAAIDLRVQDLPAVP